MIAEPMVAILGLPTTFITVGSLLDAATDIERSGSCSVTHSPTARLKVFPLSAAVVRTSAQSAGGHAHIPQPSPQAGSTIATTAADAIRIDELARALLAPKPSNPRRERRFWRQNRGISRRVFRSARPGGTPSLPGPARD